MEGYSDSVELYEESLNVAGIATQKFGIWQESSQAKLEKFKATLQTIYQTSFDTGTIKDIINFGTKLLDVISNLQQSGIGLKEVIIALTTVFFIFNNTALNNFYNSIVNAPANIMKLIASLNGLNIVMKATTISTNLLKIAISTFVPFAIITGITYLIQKLVELKNANKEAQETFSKSLSSIDTDKNEIQKAKDLQSEYDKLRNKTSLTIDEKERLRDVQNELVKIFPNLRYELDAEGNAIINNTNAISENIKIREEEFNRLKENLAKDFEISGDAYRTELEQKRKALEQEKAFRDQQLEFIKNTEKSDMSEGAKQRYLDDLNKKLQQSSQRMTKLSPEVEELSKKIDSLGLAYLQTNERFKSFDASTLYNIIDLFNTLHEKDDKLNFFSFIDKIDTGKLNDFQKALDIFRSNDDIEALNKSYTELYNHLVEIASQSTETQKEAEELANSFLKNIAPVESTKIAIKQLEIGIKQASLGIKGATNTIANAFVNLGVAISKATIGILSNFGAVLDGIQSLMDVPVAMDKIIGKLASEKGIKKGSYEYDFFASNVRSQYSDMSPALQALAQAREDINKAKKDINNFTGGKSSSSSSKSFEKTFEVWKEALEAINIELETLKDQLDDVNSFEQKTEIYDQMILLLEKKQNLLLDISKTFDSNLQQAEQKLRSYIGKGLSESDFNKIMSGSTDTIEVDIKNEKIAKAIEDFKKLKDSAEGLKKEIQGIDDEIRDLSFAEFKINLSIEDTKLSDLTQEKENLRNEMSLLEKGSAEYIALLERENQINIESVNILRNKIALTQQELASDRYNADQKKELIDTLKQLKQEYVNLQFSIKQQLASVADEIIQIYKNIYEKQKQAALNALDEQMKAEERRHKRATDNIDDELKQFENYINAKLKALDREENEHDYQRELDKKQKARQELLDKIGLLSMDDTVEAKLQLAELNKQLAQQEDEITEYQHDHSIDLRKENLKDQLDAYKKDIDAKKKAEDTKYDLEKDRLDRIKRETERHYDDMINDERRWAKLRADIINGNIDEVKSAFSEFKNFLNSNLEFIGNSITANLITKMEQAIAVLQSYQSQSNSIPNIPDESFTGGNTTGGSSKQTGLVKPGMLLTEAAAIAGISVVYHPEDNTVTIGDLPTRFSPAGIGGTHLNAQNRIVIDEIENIKRLIKMAGGDVSKFHEGGIVGSKTSGFVDKFNKFFNTNANEHIIKAITDEILTPPKNIERYLIPNMQKLIANTTPQLQFAGGGVTNVYHLNMKIGTVQGNREGGQTVFKEVVRGLKSMGK